MTSHSHNFPLGEAPTAGLESQGPVPSAPPPPPVYLKVSSDCSSLPRWLQRPALC